MADDIPFNTKFDVEHGVSEQISPMIRRVVAPNEGPFTMRGTCTYIVGAGEVAIIDPGPLREAHLEALRRELEGEKVTAILVTHTHNDHSPLATVLAEETGATIYAQGPHISPSDKSHSGPNLDEASDRDFNPDKAMAHGDIIEGPGWTFECVFTPGHTANHMTFALREERALFSGDHVMGWSTSVVAPPDGNMADYMASLRLLTDRDDRVYWPGHGGPVTEPNPFVRAFITHRKMRERAIVNCIESGDRLIADMVVKIYRNLDPRLHGAAQLSVRAHIEDLRDRGIIVHERIGTDDTYRMA